MEREEYRDEIEKMNMISQKLYDELEEMKRRYAEVDLTLKEKYRLEQIRNEEVQQELEKWKNRFSALEISKNKELEDLKMMMESQRKSMIDREIRELQIKFDSERTMLENEIRKTREILENKNQEFNRLKSDLSRLEIQNAELREDQNKLHEYENKVVMISQETMRLNELLRSRQEDIDNLRSNESKLNQKLAENERLRYEHDQLISRFEHLEQEFAKSRSEVSRLQEDNRKKQILVEKIPEYERLLNSSG